jgi:hypothetical protein
MLDLPVRRRGAAEIGLRVAGLPSPRRVRQFMSEATLPGVRPDVAGAAWSRRNVVKRSTEHFGAITLDK